MTNMAPWTLVFGKKIRFPFDRVYNYKIDMPKYALDLETWSYDFNIRLKHLKSAAHETLVQYASKMKDTADKNRITIDFPIGSKVLYYVANHQTGNKSKLAPKFTGPWTVITKHSELLYTIESDATHEQKKVNVKQLKRYKERTSQIVLMRDVYESAEKFIKDLADLHKLAPYTRRNPTLLRRTPTYCATPFLLAGFIASKVNPKATRIADLMAGTGNITQYLPRHTLAVESDIPRFQLGRRMRPHARWLRCSIFSRAFLKSQVFGKPHWDCIVTNPTFEAIFPTLMVALNMIRSNPIGRILLLAPSNYFSHSKKRHKLFMQAPFTILTEWRVGSWNYYPKTSAAKRTEDSLFELGNRKITQNDHGSHTTYLCSDMIRKEPFKLPPE